MRKFIYIAPLSLFLLQGCSALINGHTVAIDSYASQAVVPGTYYLSTENLNQGIQRPKFEISLDKMLVSKGYTRTFLENTAQYNIIYDYKVTGPYTVQETFPAPVNEWWGADVPYDGVYNGMFDAAWYSNTQYVNYFVKELSLTAYSKGNPIWQVKSHVQAETPNPNSDYEYLISGISDYIDQSSGKIIYLNIVKNEKTGEFTVSKW